MPRIRIGKKSFLSIYLHMLLFSILASNPSHASTFNESETIKKTFDTFTLYWENDLFAGTDSEYTNGILFSWSTPYLTNNKNGSHMPDWSYWVINRLPFVNDPMALRAASLSFGQLIFTPEDIQASQLIEDDRPYAGYLYLGSGFNSVLENQLSTWQFNAGIVGPASLAQQTQDLVHNLLGIPKAQGWDNQLKNEPTIEAIFETKWRVLFSQNPSGFGYDFIPHLGARIGNVAIYANGGAELRMGWFVPYNFGSCGIRPGCEINPAFNHDQSGDFRRTKFSIHLFTMLDSRLVLRDIFLDGNTFKDSHSVEKEYFVADLMVGIAFHYKRLKFSYAYTFRSKEFKLQKDPHAFGSLSVSVSY